LTNAFHNVEIGDTIFSVNCINHIKCSETASEAETKHQKLKQWQYATLCCTAAMPQPQHSTAAPPVGPAHPLLTKTVHSDSLVKLPDGLNLWYQLRLAWALVSAPQGLVLQENLLQGTGQVPVVDFVEALVIGLKGSAGEVCARPGM
jgi:hypothetical protein